MTCHFSLPQGTLHPAEKSHCKIRKNFLHCKAFLIKKCKFYTKSLIIILLAKSFFSFFKIAVWNLHLAPHRLRYGVCEGRAIKLGLCLILVILLLSPLIEYFHFLCQHITKHYTTPCQTLFQPLSKHQKTCILSFYSLTLPTINITLC